MEISETCRRIVKDRIPEFRFLEGDIHGAFDGPFLETGPYDAIFCFHTLVHCIDVHDSLGRLRRLVRDGGCAVFSREIVRKPTNPFHMIFPTEIHFRLILDRHFDRVDRIDDCDKDIMAHINPFTEKGDSPDLVGWAGAPNQG